MEARDFYDKRINEEPTIGSVQLMEEYAKHITEINNNVNKCVDWGFAKRRVKEIEEHLNHQSAKYNALKEEYRKTPNLCEAIQIDRKLDRVIEVFASAKAMLDYWRTKSETLNTKAAMPYKGGDDVCPNGKAGDAASRQYYVDTFSTNGL